MAKSITRRTLAGFRKAKVNLHHFEDLINQITHKPAQFIDKVQKGKTYWKTNNNDTMKFNAIIGNPPYQVMDGGSKASATPVYQHFVDIAKKIQPDYTSMIMPAKWYNGGRGLDDFRKSMLNDKRIKKIVDFVDSNDCFEGVDIAGGICYYLWDKAYSGKCSVVTHNNGKRRKNERYLDQHQTFHRNHESISIIEKIKKDDNLTFLSSHVSSQKPFGLRTYVKPNVSGELTLRYSGGKGPFEKADVTYGIDWIEKWKVITSYLTYDHAGRADKNGQKRIISTLEILKPNEICTETYIVLDVFENEFETINFLSYIKTKFVRFLVGELTSTQHLSKDKFALVPLQDFTTSSDIDWSQPVEAIDRQLYAKYGLSEEEVAFIEGMIKGM
jgi:hypothetical protein